MSVIIKGMEMPEKNCDDCFFCDDFAKCQLLNLNNIFDYCKDGIERPAKCPLLSLPKGYGRLIDADALCRFIANNSRIDGIIAAGIISYINAARTIVPAEGGEGNA